jgi:predicted  nucleic acid-binding Zn-ribbon protein
MPQVFAQLPYPRAALGVLETFAKIAGLEIDLAELREQAATMDGKLNDLLSQIEQATDQEETAGDETSAVPEADDAQLSPEDQQNIENLFDEARRDRSKAYELKRELDRLGVFRDYEDRFLDLFKKPG